MTGMSVLQPGYIDRGGQRLFSVFRPVSGCRGAALFCAPFLQEHFLSYRLFCLIAERFATQGIASLRFDYRGCGDSAGDGESFSLAAAYDDAESALQALCEQVPAVPLVAFGARAGAWPAAMLASRHRLRLWLWQPLPNGDAWMDGQEQLDASERGSTLRYPLLRGVPRPDTPGRLLGYPCDAAQRAQMRAARLGELIGTAALPVAAAVDAHAPDLLRAQPCLRLPPALAAWHSTAYMQATFFTQAVAGVVDALAATLDGNVDA